MAGGRITAIPTHRAMARRQIGSAVKPGFSAAVEEEGYDRNTRVIDEPVVYMVNGQEWQPQNYDQRYRGVIPLWQALAESVNTVPVRLVHEMGVDRVFAFLGRMGLPLVGEGRRNDRALSPLALGGLTQGVTPLVGNGHLPAVGSGRSPPLFCGWKTAVAGNSGGGASAGNRSFSRVPPQWLPG